MKKRIVRVPFCWILFSLLSVAVSSAEPPKSPKIRTLRQRCREILCPLEAKRTQAMVREVKQPAKPTEQFTLKGVSRISSGWLVVVANTKAPKKILSSIRIRKTKKQVSPLLKSKKTNTITRKPW